MENLPFILLLGCFVAFCAFFYKYAPGSLEPFAKDAYEAKKKKE